MPGLDTSKVRTRSGQDLNIQIKHVKFYRAEPLDHSKACMLPTYMHLYQRFFTIKADLGKEKGAWKTAVEIVTSEFIYDWVMMNVYTISHQAVFKKFDKILNNFKCIRDWPIKKRTQKSFNDKADALLSKLDHGVDIFCKQIISRKNQETEFGVKMTEQEFAMYEDNCIPVLINGEDVCVRKVCTAGVDSNWIREAKTRQAKLEKKEYYRQRRELRLCKEDQNSRLLKGDEAMTEMNFTLDLQDSPEKVTDAENNFNVLKQQEAPKKLDFNEKIKVPCIPVRTGSRSVDPRICQLLVDLESKFGIESRKSRQVLAHIANSELFQQKWEVKDWEDSDNVDVIASGETYPMTYVLPSRRTVAQYIKDSAIMNFKHIGDRIIKGKADGNTVLTFGSDDTKKAAGHKTMDVKTGHITMVSSDGVKNTRETFSTGYLENISHSGGDSAAGVEVWLTQMSILTDVPYQELLDMFDFWMNDRAGDSDASLDELGISPEKRLKCNAHILLCIDQALDKVFKDLETTFGVQKLIGLGASYVFSGGANSIWYLGLIAFAKLLSPSHAQQSISLFSLYKEFLTRDSDSLSSTSNLAKNLLKAGFTTFSSNRFGRLPELSSTFSAHVPLLKNFFANSVDENANKLVLACSAYLDSEWFHLCCQVASDIDTILTQPLKAALGIDENQHNRSESRSWSGLKKFFSEKLEEMDILSKQRQGMTNKEYLLGCAARNIKVAMERQLEYVEYYTIEEDMEQDQYCINTDKLGFAPLTNSGCESQFADLDNSVRKFGGTALVSTLSDKHVIRKNKFFESEEWKSMSIQEKKQTFSWARGSKQAQKVAAMQKEWVDKVTDAKSLALVGKESKKKKKNERSLKLLDKCKEHNGPVTQNTTEILDVLSAQQLVTEVRYLRVTLAPNIREKVKVDNKFRNLTKSELKNEILKVIKPESNLDSLETLFSDLFSKDWSETLPHLPDNNNGEPDQSSKESSIHPGLAGLWCGPLKEQCVGVVVPRGSDDVLQLYSRGRHGYFTDGRVEDLIDWSLVKSFEKVMYVTKARIVYLQF